MKSKTIALIFVLALLPASSAHPDYGVHFVNDSLLKTVLDQGESKISFRFTCLKDLDLIAVSFYCVQSLTPPAYKIGIQEDLKGLPAGTFLESSSITPKGESWATVPINHLSLRAGTVYHLVIEQDKTMGGQHPVGIIDAAHFAAVGYGNNLNLFDPRNETPDPKMNVLVFEKNKWNIVNHQPFFALHGSGSKFQGVPYDQTGELPIYGMGTLGDHSRDVLQGECLHPHYGFTPTGFAIRIRRQGHPSSPLNCRVYSNDFMHHKTALVFSCQALLPAQIPVSFQWVTIGLPLENRPPAFPPECRYVVFQTDSGRAVSQAPGCEDCYLLSEVSNSGGLASASDLTFDGGAHLSREATSTDGGANWVDAFERDANVVILGPVNFSPGLPTPEPIPTPPPFFEEVIP